MMDITSMQIECNANGTKITAWCKCASTEEIDDLIAWLELAKQLHLGWREIRARHNTPATIAVLKKDDKT